MSIGDSATERRRGLGRGLGALIPSAPTERRSGPHDLYFSPAAGHPSAAVDPAQPPMTDVAGLSLHEVLVAVFLFITAPVSAHIIAKAALHRRCHSVAPVPPDEESGVRGS